MRMDVSVAVSGVGEELVGYRLAGVSEIVNIENKNPDEAYEALSGKAGVILITKRAAENLGGKTEKLRQRGIVLVLPEAGEEDANIKKLIRDTVGFDLKKK